MAIEITLKGQPLSTNHIYKFAGHRMYMIQEGKTLKEDYQWQIKKQYKDKPIIGDVDLRIELFFGDKRIRDIDNYNKLVLDACSKILWKDDVQIMSLLIVKNYDKDNPRVELLIN